MSGSKDLKARGEIRARARTSSTDTMMPENTQLLPTLPNSHTITEMAVVRPLKERRKMSLTKILLLNAVVCGVEICACAGFTYIPPMLLKTGYTEENMSIILGLGPLLGFFLVPLIGRASDRCRSRYGRRRPFILAISFVLILSLLVIPYGDKLTTYLLGEGSLAKRTALLLLTLGVVFLDFTSQACLTPCEALLSDASRDTDQHERAFIVYSLMVSLGGFLGYLITAIDWNNTHIGLFFKTQERTVFSLLTILYVVMCICTIATANEQPLQQQKPESSTTTQQTSSSLPNSDDTLLEIGSNSGESGYDTNGSENGVLVSKDVPTIDQSPFSPKRTRWPRFTAIPRIGINYLVTCKIVFASCNLLRLIWVNIYEKLPEPFQRLCEIPYVLRQLALAHFCSWTAVMGFNLFFTDFVGNSVYEGNANAPEDSYLRARFDEGVRMGSWGLLLHCITSAIYALFVERIVSRYGCKLTYSIGMTTFIVAMCGMVLFRHVILVNLMAAFTGIAYATVTTIPFILVTKYHNEKDIYFFDVIKLPGGTVTNRGVATDMATLDSAYFLSQVVLSCIMGYIVYMTGSVLSYMVTAGVMGVLSLFFIQNVITSQQEVLAVKQSNNTTQPR